DGFLKILGTDVKTTLLPALKEKDVVICETLEPKQHFTEPPARYSDATLVKALEEYDIGRPSTYAPTIATIIDRKYVDRIEGRKLKPTDIGILVNDLLVEHFPQIVDYTFTATMENALDGIAAGTKDWQPILATFYEPFKANLKAKEETLTKKTITEEKTDEICDKCGKPMVIKTGRFGRFLACTGFPECRNTKQLTKNTEGKEVIEAPITTDEKCTTCGAPMIVKRGRFGPFLSCSTYPECKTIKSIEKKTGVKCQECKEGDIVAKRSKKGGRTFYACNRYPECTFALWSKPTGASCPTCGSLLVYGAKETVRCSKKECAYSDRESTN
ncbi:MAG: topoisomerase DNA-binding C4 zinc finger domain-containing protein, partial [Candidatus Yonathbacteria bacterium]|nr:topoisomerase DNA-binding C4 zinc finger domain-containing protein [Candidatus Yonathbacteria bacterium]